MSATWSVGLVYRQRHGVLLWTLLRCNGFREIRAATLRASRAWVPATLFIPVDLPGLPAFAAEPSEPQQLAGAA